MSDGYTSRTLREILRVLWGRFPGILLILVIILGAVVLATSLAPRWYRSEALIMAKHTTIGKSLEQASSAREDVSLFVVTQREMILSDFVLVSALMRLENPSSAKLSADQWYTDDQISRWASENSRFLRKARQRIEVVTPGGAEISASQTYRIRVDWPEERQLAAELNIDGRQLAAKRACELTGYLVDAYRLRYRQLEGQRISAAASFLSMETLTAAKNELKAAEDALSAFITTDLRGDLRVVNAMAGKGSGGEQGASFLVTRFQGQFMETEAKLAGLEAQLANAREQLKRPAAEIVVGDSLTAANPVLRVLQDRIVDLKLAYNAMQPRYTDTYQELVHTRQELAIALQDLYDELSRQAQRLEMEIAEVRASHMNLKAAMDQEIARVEQLAGKTANYERLQRDVDAARKRYDLQVQRSHEAQEVKKLAENPIVVQVLNPATLPNAEDPRKPVWIVNILLGLLAGVIMSLVYAFLADFYDHSMKSVDDVEKYLDTPVLGSVPMLRRRIIHAG
jgi:uncharacterized protein involved in exopolysaccharide biosynthesis